jgi:hypothetical protein
MPDTKHLISRRRLACLIAFATALPACETLDPAVIDGILGAGGAGGLTQFEASQGIKAALDNGIGQAVATVGREGGFFNDNIIKIPLPTKLAEVQSTLGQFGASGLLDELELQLNRGAEKAAPVAKDIFVSAVSQLSIADAIGIVRGADNAATTYLQDKTTARLTQLFSPILENALGDTGALRLVDQLDGQLSGLGVRGLGASAKSDLISHGVKYGLSGVFHYIGEEERLIRENPAKRTSEILRKVFGYYS